MVPEQRRNEGWIINYFKFSMINADTRFLGLLGDPVAHSLSPAMHNAALQSLGLNWLYLGLPCKSENLEVILNGLINTGCLGLNVTIPHKNNVAFLCKELSPLAQKLKTVNTILPRERGGWYGTNTDVEGFLYPLKYSERELGKKALIIGCGGSARAIISGLESLHFTEIIIVGRKVESLNTIINDLKYNDTLCNNISTKLEGILQDNLNIINHINTSDLIINTTPIGMSKYNQEDNINNIIPLGKEIWSDLNHTQTLYDLIYTPKPTPWLQLGASKGCKIIDGLEMLIQQGAASLRIWTGIEEIPITIMREAAEVQLNLYN